MGTLLSRLSGLIREVVLAGVFGAGLLMDCFLVANRIPNMLREMAAEGALGSSFTKVFSSLSVESSEKAKSLWVACFWFFSLILLVLCTVGVLAAPWLVDVLTLYSDKTRGPEFIQQTVGLTRILFPFIGIMTLSSLVAGVLHERGKFFVSALSPVSLNLGYILGALGLSYLLQGWGPDWIESYIADKKVTGLALGVLLGGLCQLLWQMAVIWRTHIKGVLLWPKSFPWSQDLKKVMVLMGPMLIASSATQINVFINTNFATSLEVGAVSWLSFAFRVLLLPVGIFAVAIGTASLPSLTKSLTQTKGKVDASVVKELSHSLDLSLWLLIPCSCFLLVNSRFIVELLFYHGKFQLTHVEATATALYCYSFGLLGYGLIKVLTSFYYALEKTRFAMNVSLLGIVINFVANYYLVEEYGYVGLSLTTSLVVTWNALLLMVGLVWLNVRFDYLHYSKLFVLMVGTFTLSWWLQSFCAKNLGEFLPIGLGGIKLQAFSILFANLLSLVFVFLLGASVFYQKTPGYFISILSKPKR